MFSKAFKIYLALICSIGSLGAFAHPLLENIRAAETHDPTFASFNAYRLAAEQNVAIGKSRLLPQVTAQGSLANVEQRREVPAQAPFNGTSSTSQLMIKQGLFRPRDWLSASIGELQNEYGYYKYNAAKSDLWSRVSMAWFDFLVGLESERTQNDLTNNLYQVMLQVQKQAQAGTSTKDLEVEAMAQYQLAQAQWRESQQNLIVKKNQLRQLTGKNPDEQKSFALNTSALSRLESGRAQQVYEYTMASAEVSLAQLSALINEKKHAQARYDHLPSVDLYGSYGQSRSDTINTIGQRYATTQLGLQISIPIFTGGSITASEKQAAYTAQASKDELRAAELRIEQLLLTEFSVVQSLQQKMQAQQELVEAAETQIKAARLGVQSGVRSLADLGNAHSLKARRLLDLQQTKLGFIRSQLRILAILNTESEEWLQWLNQIDYLVRQAP